jgi:hypothetical protein
MPAEATDGEEPLIYLSPAPPRTDGADARCVLYEPWFEIDPAARGSASWRHAWLTSDHILLSAGLFDRQGWRYRPGSFTPARLPFLLDERGFPRPGVARGKVPGVSDHLPILLVLDTE